jgi:cation:H+ antiporter
LPRWLPNRRSSFSLLIGSLPLAYGISGGTFSPLDFDERQSEEIFLTAGQSLFAVAILISLSMGRWEAIVLAGLFVTQFAFTDTTIRVAYGAGYCVLALIILARDIPHFRPFFSAAKETWTDPGGNRSHAPPPASGPP